MKIRWRLVAGFVTALAASGAMAQAVTFFQNEGFRGPSFSQNTAIGNFERFGFNDRASSVVIRSGAWQLCSDAGFGGNCVTLRPGSYPNLGAMGMSRRVSSARPVGGGPPPPSMPMPMPPSRPMPMPPPSGGNSAVVLFDGFGLGGERFRVDGPIDNFDRTQWNDRARSMIVRRGRWQLCSDAYFRNNCAVFGPGRYDNLGGLAGSVSSIRPVR
jgi:Beta/Gamma crystallin